MSDTSARLALPYLMPSQAQKHVTHNEALRKLDVLVQLTVEAFDAATPPSLPEDGQVWALGPAPTGAWAGHPHELAIWDDGNWSFEALTEGRHGVGKSDHDLRVWTGTSWVAPLPDFASLDGVGLNTTADATNRLAVAAPAALFTHDGAGHQIKVNKATATDTASLLFQSGWSGRAEMGTNGSDDFSIKVSPDGATWSTALSADAATGQVSMEQGLHVTGQISGTAITQSATDPIAGRLLKTGDFGLGEGAGVRIADIDDLKTSGMYSFFGGNHNNATAGDNPFPSWSGAAGLLAGNGNFPDTDGYQWQLAFKFSTSSPSVMVRVRAASTQPFSPWYMYRTSENTTVDANGFIKEASPIIRLFNDRIEMPCVPVGASFSRLGHGHYQLLNVAPLATSGWQVEVPQDANGNRLVFVETSYDAGARCLDIRTSTIAWNGAWVAGTPLDIPEGRWVDLRFDAEDSETEQL